MKIKFFTQLSMSVLRTIVVIVTGVIIGQSMVPQAPVMSEETFQGYTKISTVEELAAIRDNPGDCYVLTKDINLAGFEWIPFEFHGILDGNGYSLLNMTVHQVDEKLTEVTYDGNVKPYDTYLSGMFSVLRDAQVRNIRLINQRIDVDTDTNCFIGGIAGFAENTVIDNCTLTGQIKLYVSSMMFGVGGVVGYGYGSIDHTVTDQELIIVDTDTTHKNEEFLGGAVGAGYYDIMNSNINIKGYVSDHGFVHNGGVMGMYMFYPEWVKHDGYLTGNSVKGFITFFEDNTNRRAYCAPYIGEIIHWSFEKSGNSDDFVSDERFTYDRNLLPQMCEDAEYEVTTVESTENTYGYTTYTCPKCGYSYTDHYTIYEVAPTPTPTPEPTSTSEPAQSEAETTQTPESAQSEAETTQSLTTTQPPTASDLLTAKPLAPPEILSNQAMSDADSSFPSEIIYIIGAVVIIGICIALYVILRQKRRH